jgi:hypothetical protein
MIEFDVYSSSNFPETTRLKNGVTNIIRTYVETTKTFDYKRLKNVICFVCLKRWLVNVFRAQPVIRKSRRKYVVSFVLPSFVFFWVL